MELGVFSFPQLWIAFPHLLDLAFSPCGHWCLSEKGLIVADLLPLFRGSQGSPRSELIPVSSQNGDAPRALFTCHLRKGMTFLFLLPLLSWNRASRVAMEENTTLVGLGLTALWKSGHGDKAPPSSAVSTILAAASCPG